MSPISTFDMKFITVTLNPALDRIEYLDGFSKNSLNRPYRTAVKAGGKGVNVARCLAKCRDTEADFTCSVTAVTLLGGHTGEEMKELLLSENTCPERYFIDHVFLPASYPTRQAIKLVSLEGTTEINEAGIVAENDLYRLIDAFADLFSEGHKAVVILSGSMPKIIANDFSTENMTEKSFPHSVDKNVENSLVTLLESCGIPVVIDTSGKGLRESIKASPSLIKPNEYELSELAERQFASEDELVEYCRELYVDNGCEVLLTRGENGALFVGKKGIFKQISHRVFPCDPTGAGDTFLGAFVYAYYGKRMHPKDALLYADSITHRYLLDSIPR